MNFIMLKTEIKYKLSDKRPSLIGVYSVVRYRHRNFPDSCSLIIVIVRQGMLCQLVL